MSSEVFSSFEIKEIFIENDFQKVFLCNEKETQMPFLVNAILDKRVYELLDLDKIEIDNDIFIKIFKSERILYIITKYLEFPTIKEYYNNNKVSLSTQIKFTEFLLNKLVSLRNFPDYIINSLLNHNNILVKNDELKLLGLILLDNEYIEFNTKKIYNTVANTLSVIYCGKIIKENKIDKNIPPDIRKIISKCLNDEYEDFSECNNDFKTSKLYSLINPEVIEANRFYKIRKNLTNKKNIIKSKKRILYFLIILMLLSPFIIKGMSRLINYFENILIKEDLKANNIKENDVIDIDDNLISDEENKDKINEDINRYFDENNIDYGIDMYIARLDDRKVHKGSSSLLVENKFKETIEFLISNIDLNKDEFKYLKDRNASISFWLNGEEDYNCEIIIKVFNDEKLVSTKSNKIFIPKDTWTMHTIGSKLNGNLVKVYLKIANANVWIDTFEIEILK